MKRVRFKADLLISAMLLIIFSLCIPVMCQTLSDGSAPQFIFPDFIKGMVKMKNGSSQSALLNYNSVSETIVYEKDDQIYDLIHTETIDTVFIEDRRFVPAGSVFHEVLLIAPISLFVQYKGELIRPGAPAGYGGTSQVSNTKLITSVELASGYYNLQLPADYSVKVETVFWLRINGNMESFVNERQFLKIFPEKQDELKQFIKKNKIKFDKFPQMISLIKYTNELNP
jgi:hypothetical protein